MMPTLLVQSHRPPRPFLARPGRRRGRIAGLGLALALLLSPAAARAAGAPASPVWPTAADGEQAPAPPASDGQSPAGSHAAPPTVKGPMFADSTLMYVAGPAYRNPFVTSTSQPNGADIFRSSVEFKHVDAWAYGHNTIEFVIKKSTAAEPAAGGGAGALGLYSIFRSGVGLNRLASRPLVAIGPLRDIDLQVGMNLETKSSGYAPQERSIFVGPNLQFRAGAGFLNVGLHLRKEWNHNGNLGRSESYDVDFNVEPVWHFPFRVGGVRLAFDGYADYNTAKGRDATGHATRPEFLTRPLLRLDVSRLVGQKARVLEIGVGFEYWHNMFGKDATSVPGARQLTPVVTVAAHLPLGAGGR